MWVFGVGPQRSPLPNGLHAGEKLPVARQCPALPALPLPLVLLLLLPFLLLLCHRRPRGGLDPFVSLGQPAVLGAGTLAPPLAIEYGQEYDAHGW